MKIAVLDSDGIQSTKQGKMRYYYAVDDDYDFVGNSATDVTSVENSQLFFSIFRIDYGEYRDYLIGYATGTTFSAETMFVQKELAKNFAVDKTDRDIFYSLEDQESNAVRMQELLYKSDSNIIFVDEAMSIATGGTASNNSVRAKLFGNKYKYKEENATSNTTSNSYVMKLRMKTPNLKAGTYKVSWNSEVGNGGVGKRVNFRVQIDDLTTIYEVEEMSNFNSQFIPVSGFKVIELSSGVHDIDLDWSRNASDKGTAKIKDARIEIFRVK